MVDKINKDKFDIEPIEKDKEKPIILEMRDFAFAQILKDLTTAIKSLDEGIRGSR